MKRLLQSLTILFFLTTTLSCSDDNNDNDTTHITNITIQALYTTSDSPNVNKPDINDKVFIYYDVYSENLAGYNYYREGVFKKREEIIMPEESYTANEDGIVTFTPKYDDKKITIVVESNYYQNRIAISSYNLTGLDINQTTIFNP